MVKTSEKQSSGIGVALGLVFLSGFAALVYQVLWMKQIGLLFGNTSQAASATLASFFAGLAIGSWVLGRRVSKSTNPMRTYAWLEVAIAVTALLYFVILALYQAIYPSIYQSIGNGGLLLVVKFGLSLLLVFPPAFCMGGTIPVIGQYMIREPKAFGNTAALMYGVNTLGAAIGAALAGFYLPLWLGFNATCALAIVVSVAVAIVAFRLSKRASSATFQPEEEKDPVAEMPSAQLTRQERRRLERDGKRGKNPLPETQSDISNSPSSGKPILILAFLSGFGVLALEVLWTRLFMQVLEHSVYTFAAILVVVLICLALGAMLSSLLTRLKGSPFIILSFLVLAGATAVSLTPKVFMSLTNGMQIVASLESWPLFVLLIFKTVTLTIGPSALLLGTIFPYLMKLEERHLKSPGLSLGYLATANTVGAIIGALLCGFVMLDALGIWLSMQAISLIYLVAALLLPLRWNGKSIATKAACFAVILINLIALNPRGLPIMGTDPLARDETVIETWEGSDCTVAVTESDVGLAIKINSLYSLGDTASYMQEKFQGDLPLWVYPESEDVFFLGVGTGISAGGALDPRHQSVKRVVACELIPEVITAAKKYFTDVHMGVDYPHFDTTTGLFTDPRATVLIEDGRHHLMASDEQYDIINADLFVPFSAGAGSLYSREHFESSKKRLTPDGVFVQWLPLHQLTENEFSIIAKTMLEVFDQVSMWRRDFNPGHEVIALVGHRSNKPLPATDIDSREDKFVAVSGKTHRDIQFLNLPIDPNTILLFYGGNLTAAKSLFEGYPINADNRPIIEYMAPRTFRNKNTGELPWFVGEKFAKFVDKVQEICPPENDPLLANRTSENRRLPLAGSAFHRAGLATIAGDEDGIRAAWEKFVTEWMDRK